MSTNPLTDISKVYLEQIAESAVPGKPAERLGAVTAIPQSERDAARERTLAKAKAMRDKKGITKEALDPVGQEDSDIDNDGDSDKTDKYLHKRRKAIGKAIATRKESLDPVGKEDKDIDNDGDVDKSDKYLHKRRKAIGKAIAKEGYSNWRQDLSEVMVDDVESKQIKEKKVNNKIKINPNLKESVEELGGILIEMVEVDEVDYIVESVYDELLDEGYEEDDIEEAIEFALVEAKVTFGHDTPTGEKKRGNLVKAVGRLARQKLASKVSGAKKAAKQAVATGARKVAKGALGVARKMEGGDKKPTTAARKPSTYRGAGAGTKERVSSGSYTPPAKKKAEKPADPWEGSATTPPKAKKKKAAAPKAKAPAAAAPKRKRKSKLDDLLASVRSEEAKPFPFKKVEAQKEKARKGSVYGKDTGNAPVPQVSDAEKKATTRFSKMQQTYEKAKRAKQEADKARRSSTFYKDTHPASAPKMKKANEEFQLDEKAVSQQQQKFMGMVYAVKKGEMKAPSAAVAKAASSMSKKAAKDFAKTKHAGLPKKVEEEVTTMDTAPAVDQKKQMLDKQKLANLKMLQQKKQQLDRQKLQMQKSGKLPLEAD